MDGAPAGAVGRNDVVGGDCGEGIAGRRDDRLEVAAAEVESADHRVEVILAGQALDVAERVDQSRVAAAGENDEPAPADFGDDRLVIEDQRVALPAAGSLGLMGGRGPALEAGRPIDLAGDEQRAVEQERRLLALDDLEAGTLERASAGRRKRERLAALDRDPPPGPELG